MKEKKILVYINKMGQWNSKQDNLLKVEDYEKRLQTFPYCWKDIGEKNSEYYKGNRYFLISREFYPHLYTKGYLYGRYYNDSYYRDMGYEYDEKLEKWVEVDIFKEL